MIKLIKVTPDPSISIEFRSEYLEEKSVLLVWEDAKYKTPLFTDILTLSYDVNNFSCLNKPLSFFNDGVVFKIIDLKTYEVIFEYISYNLNFLQGKNILYISRNDHSGYAHAARNCIYQLLVQGYNVRWSTHTFHQNELEYVACNEYEKLVDSCKYNSLEEYDSVIIHSTPLDYNDLITKLKIKKQTPIYVSTVWETTQVPTFWCDILNGCDFLTGIIVPSNFNVDVFKNSNINLPIYLWKYDTFPITLNNKNLNIDLILSKFIIYDKTFFGSDVSLIKSILESKVIFYNINQYNTRKNIDQLIRTFCKTYTKSDNVCLMLKTFLVKFTHKEKEYLKFKIKKLVDEYKNPPIILICLEELNTEEINFLHIVSDIYFTVSRGEGFGISTYIAKKIGNKIICGSFGSELEFVDENDCVIPCDLRKPHGMISVNNLYESGSQLWASYKDENIVACLKKIDIKN